MTAPKHSRWETVKAKRRAIDPDPDFDAKVAKARRELYAGQIGYNLTEMRTAAGLSVADVAATMGVESSLVEQMEDGQVSAMRVDMIADYIAALGGQLKLIADVGPTNTTVLGYGLTAPDNTARDVA